VVYFNPADMEHPIAFNVVEQVDPRLRHLVASGLLGVFQKLWADSWGPRLEYILRNAILAILDYPGATLLAVTRMFSDKEFRKKVIDKIQDPVVKSFWVYEFSGYADKFAAEAVSPIQNKVGQFLSSSLIRNIVGQVKSSIDIRKLMDDGKILILNLSKGRIGEDNSALLGAMMITKVQLAAMSRVDTKEHERKDFYLYVDEFQNFATESFANILSEARKYRLNLIMAHQYIEQLD
jgi:type IV secretory pathway TraG/TraD family ATPase VirD4